MILRHIMKKEKHISNNGMELIFPIPIYRTRLESNLDSSEKKDIEDIIKEGMKLAYTNSLSKNTYIFDTKLKKLKEFIEQHLENCAKHFISPKEETEIYITQSWLTKTKAGEHHNQHYHQNSIISGVFYISTVEDDRIFFKRPTEPNGIHIKIYPKESTPFNTESWALGVNTLDLLLFPSWLEHSVPVNDKQTYTDRMSISFNTFVKGPIGNNEFLTELIL